jgi:hypothetical protein
MPSIDIIGKKYNKLTILDIIHSNRVLVLCDCGTKKDIAWQSVKRGSTKTCGCEQRSARIKHKAGNQYGRLTIKKRLPNNKVIAECECGNIKEFYLCALITKKTRSCGCLNIENLTSHGLCGHPIYGIWEGVIQRCYNKNNSKYHNYGGRGVMMCDEWRNDFKIFYDWCIENGWNKDLDLDKDIKGNGLIYGPYSCCFVTHKENTRSKSTNRYITHNDETLCLASWAEKLGINYSVLKTRLDRGWSIERAFKNENFTHNQLKKAS